MPRHHRGWGIGRNFHNQERHTPITLAILEPALLVLLHKQPQHGYNLLIELENLGITTIHPSVVYRILREMEDLGWIESNLDNTISQGPPRRIYKLTDYGFEIINQRQIDLMKSRDLISKLIDMIEGI